MNDESFSASKRLYWHLKRALYWLELACQNRLLDHGDPFELPVFPERPDDPRLYATSESEKDYTSWTESQTKSGIFEAVHFRGDRRISDPRLVVAFYAPNGTLIYAPQWGAVVTRIESFARQQKVKKRDLYFDLGLWALLPDWPLKAAWEMPTSWADLILATSSLGFPIEEEIKRSLPAIRDGRVHSMLIGVPIPQNVGVNPKQIQWQAVELPDFSDSRQPIKGFRPGPASDNRRDILDLSTLKSAKSWYVRSENWSQNEISTRGRLADPVLSKVVAIIGVGAFGSILADQLSRNGIQSLVIVDSDKLTIGNLSRHSLGMAEVGFPKAPHVALAIEHTSPHTRTSRIIHSFPPTSKDDRELLKPCEIIIDCTGSDDILPELEKYPWSDEKRSFFSFSLGMNGKRLFCFHVRAQSFPMESFRSELRPWLVHEKNTLGIDHPREGTGCWNAVFPARIDDLQMFVSTAVKFMEERMKSNEEKACFAVFEQVQGPKGFQGLNRVDWAPA